MKRTLLYSTIAILAFGIGTFFGLYFYSQKMGIQSVLQNETVNITSNPILQTEPQLPKLNKFINFDDLKFSGIGLGSSEKDLIKKFGKPQKTTNFGYNECAELNEKTLFYSGFKLQLLGNKNNKFKIYKIVIISTKWITASGVKVGDDKEAVINKFGKGNSEIEDSGIENLYFGNEVGGAKFSFLNNKLARIWADYTLC